MGTAILWQRLESIRQIDSHPCQQKMTSVERLSVSKSDLATYCTPDFAFASRAHVKYSKMACATSNGSSALRVIVSS